MPVSQAVDVPDTDTAHNLLYLVPGEETWVGVEGAELRVSSLSQPSRRLPLHQLGRICAARSVDWETPALLACAAHGVVITFMNDDGAVVGQLLGQSDAPGTLRQSLTDFLQRPDAHPRLHRWLETSRQQLAHRAAAKLLPGTQPEDSRQIRLHIHRRICRVSDAQTALHTRQWLLALATDWMQSRLRALGVAQSDMALDHITPKLADLLCWRLEPARYGWLKRRWLAANRCHQPPQIPGADDTARLFRSRARQVEQHGRAITTALHRWLITQARG